MLIDGTGRVDKFLRGSAYAAEPSQLERLARAVTRISPERCDLLGVLLSAALLPADDSNELGDETLRPVWANEAMHRAYTMTRLVASLERGAPRHPGDRLAACTEYRLAQDLAATLCGLGLFDGPGPRACAPPLRTALYGLWALFGPIAPYAWLDTRLAAMRLPAPQRRALVLAAVALVSDVLSDPTGACARDGIRVTLHVSDAGDGVLRVATTGVSAALLRSAEPNGVVADMASLLDCVPAIREEAGGTAAVALAFPLNL